MKNLILFMAFLALVMAPGLRAAEKVEPARELSCGEHLLALFNQEYVARSVHPSMKALRLQWTNSVPLLIRALKEKDSFGQRLYRSIHTNAPTFLSSRLPLPKTDDLTKVRVVAAQVLARMGDNAKAAIPALIACLNDSSAGGMAAYALAQIGVREEDVPVLVRLFKGSQDSRVRWNIAQCLVHTKQTPETLEVFKACLNDPDPSLRNSTSSIVGSLTNHADFFLPLLIRRLEDTETITKLNVARSIWMLSGRTNEILIVFKGVLEIEDDPIKMLFPKVTQDGFLVLLSWVAEVCGEMGPQAAPLVPLIERWIESKKPTLEFAAATALWKIEGQKSMVLSTGKVLLTHEDLAVRVKAAKTMAEFCLEQKLVAPLEDGMLDHRDLAVRVYAAWALWKVKGFDERIVPIMIEGVQHHSTYGIHRELRENFARTLGEMGRGAVMAVPALEVALDDGAPEVAAAAREALGKIRK